MTVVPTAAGAARLGTLVVEGFARQRLRRARIEALTPAARRRYGWADTLALATGLRDGNLGYRRLYAGRDLGPDTLPMLEKRHLIAWFDEFAAGTGITRQAADRFTAAPFQLGSQYDASHLLFSSSGSTGTPLPVLYHLRDFAQSLEAFTARAVRSARPDARTLLYIGLVDRHNGGNAWMYHLGGEFDVRLADVFAPPEALLDLVLDFQPDVVLTRPHILVQLAGLAAARRLPLPPAHLLSVGEGLQPEQRTAIEAGWPGPPHNSYSTVETGPLGYQRDAGVETLTVYDDLHHVELLDPAGRPITEPGVPGRIAVTTLYRQTLPLVRYRIGDVAVWTDADLGTLSFPLGRDATVLRLGAREVPELPLWSIRVDGVRQYQLIQRGPEHLHIRYEPAGTPAPHLEHALRAAVQDRLGFPVTLTVEPVEALLPDQTTGKIKRVVPLPVQ